MKHNRFLRHAPFKHPDPRFGRLILVSLLLHLAVAAVSFLDILPESQVPRKQTYYVDLVNMPVKSPQAGRPDASTEEKKAPEAPPKKPAVQKSEPPPEKVVKRKEPAPQEPPKAETVKKEPAKKKPPQQTEATKPEPEPDRYDQVRSAVDEMRRKRQRQEEIDALKEKIATLSDTRQGASTRSELGMPDGAGTQKGASYEDYLHEFLKQNWSLSRYQVSSLDLEAKVELTYNADGSLRDYRFVEKSGDTAFDTSLKTAILKANPLPKGPQERWTVTVTFNLKDLRD